jgi:hypothetical protein
MMDGHKNCQEYPNVLSCAQIGNIFFHTSFILVNRTKCKVVAKPHHQASLEEE